MKTSNSILITATLGLAVVCATSLAGCRCMEPAAESHVDVPTTVAQLRKLHNPPDVVVKVTRTTQRASVGACHSAVCVVLLPFLVKDALFPKKFDNVVVKRGGKETYRGEFHTDGELIQASVRQGDKLRVVRALYLKKLDRKVVVEVSRAAVDASGKVAKQQPVSILSQVDLLMAYREKIAKKKARHRTALVAEAAWALREEAVPLVLERLKAEPDEVRAEVLDKVCAAPGEPAKLLDSVVHLGGARTAMQALQGCHEELGVDGVASVKLAGNLVAGVCSGEAGPCLELVPSLRKWLARDSGHRSMLFRHLGLCKDPHRRAALALASGQAPSPAALKAAVTTAPLSTRRCVVPLLDGGKAQHRGLLVEALTASKSPAMNQQLLEALAAGKQAPGRAELDAVLGAYLGDNVSLEARGYALQVLHRIKDPALKTRALKKVRQALAKSPEKERYLLGAALVVLGQHDAARDAVKNAPGRQTIGVLFPSSPKRLRYDMYIVAYALKLAGCSGYEIRKSLGDLNRGQPVGPKLCLK